MVITSSDSTNTLVSLDQNDLKRIASYQSFPLTSGTDFRQTKLQLPEEDSDFGSSDYDEDDTSFCFGKIQQQKPLLYLPNNTKSSMGVDESLKCNPILMDTRDDLLSAVPVHYDSNSKERIIYVAQGEIAHCTASQADIIVSDKATTCHILAMRSAGTSQSASEPLCTLTHFDSSSYSTCVREAIQAHKDHHGDDHAAMSIHIIGGFQDANGSSREISNWLLHLLADLAQEFSDSFTFTLQTACITAMNDCNNTSPMARGLAMNCKTGTVFTAKVCDGLTGPEPQLRSARLMTASTSKLHLIHTQSSNNITLQPFVFKPFQGLESLLNLPDTVLLQYCSTSPDCEEDEFCHLLRQTLHLLRDVPCEDVFGAHCTMPLSYHRSNNNAWVAVVA